MEDICLVLLWLSKRDLETSGLGKFPARFSVWYPSWLTSCIPLLLGDGGEFSMTQVLPRILMGQSEPRSWSQDRKYEEHGGTACDPIS